MPDRTDLSRIERPNDVSSLGDNQQRAMRALLVSTSVEEAAKEAGLGYSTVRRYLSDPTFAAIFRDLRLQVLGTTVAGLQTAAAESVSLLRDTVTDESLDRNLRVRAAGSVLSHLEKLAELERRIRDTGEVEDLLHTLEQDFKARHQANGHQRVYR